MASYKEVNDVHDNVGFAEEDNFSHNSKPDDADQSDYDLAMHGIKIMINKGVDEAKDFFMTYRNENACMNFGYSFMTVMKSLISFENLDDAMAALRETEERCGQKESFTHSLLHTRPQTEIDNHPLEDRVQRDIVIADTLLYQAMMTSVNQDLKSYVKAGLLLRRAWKHYEKIHKFILSICPAGEIENCHVKSKTANNEQNYDQNDSKVSDSGTENTNYKAEVFDTTGNNTMENDDNTNNISTKHSINKTDQVDHNSDKNRQKRSKHSDLKNFTLSKEVAQRLLGAVCFGYGCFQLGLSLLPPKVLRVIEFLGFEADRTYALACLDYSANSTDMKAPLAMLTVLWYNVYLRPFYSIDGTNLNAGITNAENVISVHKDSYTNSALFMFVQARVLRIKKQSGDAFVMYEKAIANHGSQIELGYLCMYEMVWIHLLAKEWEKALDLLHVLRCDTKWSKCFYQYMIALCYGCLGDMVEAHSCLIAVPGCMRRKNNQIEQFATKRSTQFKTQAPTQGHTQLLLLEILYLWRMFPTCSPDLIHPMLDICNEQSEKGLLPLKCLVEGALYKELGQSEMASQCLKEAIVRYNGPKSELHVIAFAKYELAILYMLDPQTISAAKPLLQQIKDMADFHFDQRLSVCVRNASREIAAKLSHP